MENTVVIKIGGGEGIDRTAVLREFAALVQAGTPAVLVHGGSHETNVLSERLGVPARFITSPSGHTSRRTDRVTLEIFEMAYCGKINKAIVEELRRLGVNAIGLSGIDGGLWQGTRKNAIRAIEDGRTVIVRDDLSGTVDYVDAGLLEILLANGRTPVLTPPAITVDGIAINVDADRAAAKTAGAINAVELLLLSNVRGVLRDPSDPATLVGHVDGANIDVVRRAALGRMKNKVLAAEEAMTAGVRRVVIGSANGPSPISSARSGAGTVFEGALA
jgi:acetylglutamate/LysW-gamma-L-alpha-aminoadipate kinase